jgi:ABC-type transporter Mla MlaB component
VSSCGRSGASLNGWGPSRAFEQKLEPPIAFRGSGGGCRVRAEGEIRSVEDLRDSRDLEALLGHHCHRRRILLDLQDAPHIDSSGVSWLIHLHPSCRATGGLLDLRRAALLKVARGETNVEEVLRVIPPEELGIE